MGQVSETKVECDQGVCNNNKKKKKKTKAQELQRKMPLKKNDRGLTY